MADKFFSVASSIQITNGRSENNKVKLVKWGPQDFLLLFFKQMTQARR